MSGNSDDEFWLENYVLYYGIPSLGFKAIKSAKDGASGEDWDTDRYKHDATISSAIHSTDQYFVRSDGTYRFTPKGLWPNHNKNYKAFRDSVDQEIPLVIVDNTNTMPKEYKKYLEYAQDSGYWVSFHVMPHPKPEEAFERNAHGVPLAKIKEMIKRFQ
jgi:hypothetical protein